MKKKILITLASLATVAGISTAIALGVTLTANANDTTANDQITPPNTNQPGGDNSTDNNQQVGIGKLMNLQLVNPSESKALTIDSNMETMWTSPHRESQIDFRKHIDYYFERPTDLKQLKVFTSQAPEDRDSYSHYAIYASNDGENFQKIAFKANNLITPATGDIYDVDFKKALRIRISMRYNSLNNDGSNITKLAEFQAYGFQDRNSVELKQPQLVIDNVGSFYQSEEASFKTRFETDAQFEREAIIQNAQALATRIVGEKQAQNFIFAVDPVADGADTFTLEDTPDNKILIKGPNGISLASGFNHYLRNYLNSSYSVFFESNLERAINGPIVKISKTITRKTPYKNRYSLNFTTLSYTMAFWGEKEWLAWIDYLALNGINLTLDILGQEEVLRQLFKTYGYTDTQIMDYISGPAYFAWFYMQNMTGLGGPLPSSWFEQRVLLARKVHQRMLIYGIRPVIPGFSGQVPRNFHQIATTQGNWEENEVPVLGQGGWVGFNRPAMLRTYDPKAQGDLNGQETKIFKDMATKFYDIQKNIFGNVTDFYAVDPFHEGGNRHDMSRGGVNFIVQKRMLAANPNAIWVLQQWQNGIQANDLNQLADKSKTLVLDLQSDINPQYRPMEDARVPWVFNMLFNFGGRMGIDGEPLRLIENLKAARKNANFLSGIGLVPEAINNSPLMYELLYDLIWEDNDNYQFSDFIQRFQKARYGEIDPNLARAWDIIVKTALRTKDGGYYQGSAEPPIQGRPKEELGSASTWGHNNLNYRTEAFERALDYFILEFDRFKDNQAFMYDFVDLARQVLVNASNQWFLKMIKDYQAKNLNDFQKSSTKFLNLIRTQEKLLGTNEAFKISGWISQSQTLLKNQDDWTNDLFEFNARALISTWASKAPLLKDYSNRQLAGVTKDLYLGRWEILVDRAMKEISGESTEKAFDYDWFTFDWKWANRKGNEGSEFNYTQDLNGLNAKVIAQEIMDNYSLRAFKEQNPPIAATINFALNKNVQSSISATPEQLRMLTNSNQDTVAIFNNVTGSASFTIDLTQEEEVTSFEIWIRQIANIVPMKHRIEIFENNQWVEVSSSFEDTNPGFSGVLKINLPQSRRTSKVRFTLDPEDQRSDKINTLEIADLKVLGIDKNVQHDIEITQNTTVISSHPQGKDGHAAASVLDGNNGTVWNDGRVMDNKYVGLELQIPLKLSKAVFELQKNNVFGRVFEIVATLEDGTQTRVFDQFVKNPTVSETTFEVDLRQQTQKIKNIFLRFLQGNSPWANVADIHLFTAQDVLENNDIRNHSANSIATENGIVNPQLSNLLDSNPQTTYKVNNSSTHKEIAITFDKPEFIFNVSLDFVSKDLAANFQVILLDDLGLEIVIYDNKRATNLLATYKFDFNKKITGLKVIFPQTTNANIEIKDINLYGLNLS